METQQDRLARHNLRASLRTRERNNIESKRLDRQLDQLDWDRKRAGSLIEREMRLLSKSITPCDAIEDNNYGKDRVALGLERYAFRIPDYGSRIETPRSRSTSRLHTPNSAPAAVGGHSVPTIPTRLPRLSSRDKNSRRSARKSARKSRQERDQCSPCRFGTVRGNCTHFPCALPRQYTNIGFPVNTAEDANESPRISSAQQSSLKGLERLLLEIEALSVRRPLLSAADQTNHKEKTLKKIIDDMKVRKGVSAPSDWTVNYGKPVPFRKLMRPARPTYGD